VLQLREKSQPLLGIEHWLSVAVQTEPGYDRILVWKGEDPGGQSEVMSFLQNIWCSCEACVLYNAASGSEHFSSSFH
jgi:hypothetical protein